MRIGILALVLTLVCALVAAPVLWLAYVLILRVFG